jgi:hypothetical protein
MPFVLTATQEIDLSIDPSSIRDKRGNVAPVQGGWAWEVSDATVGVVTVNPDDSSRAVLKAFGPIGSGTVAARSDADLGEGVVPIVASESFDVVAGQAVVATITPGTPREQVDEPAPA